MKRDWRNCRMLFLSMLCLPVVSWAGVADYWPGDSWPQWRRDPAKNAFNPVSTLPATTPTTYWRFATPGNAGNSSPAVVNGKVFFGTDDGTIHCLKQIASNASGERLWSYTTGGRIWNSPAVAYNRVFALSRDGYLYCFDALTDDPNGALLWQYYCAGPIHGSPSVADARVYVNNGGGSLPNNGYRLFCLKADTARPVFSDSNGVTPGTVVYNPGLKRFLLTSYHTGPNQLGVFDAPEPWATRNIATPNRLA